MCKSSNKTGELFVIATPIGNLEDMTFRAVKVLKSVDLIAAEDTRRTKRLMNEFLISKPLSSYHDFNKKKMAPSIIKRLLNGESIALVSDAGTPGISDPGYYLIRLALDNDIPVVPIPGACAVPASLSVSGLATDRFVFEGFVEAKTTKRQKQLERLKDDERTIIMFESPYRLVQTLEAILNIIGNRQICVVRELTKIHEEFIRGDAETVLSIFKKRNRIKGEITLIIQGRGKRIKKERKTKTPKT